MQFNGKNFLKKHPFLFCLKIAFPKIVKLLVLNQKGWNQKEKPLSIKIFDCWVMGFVLKTNCKKKPFIVFHFWEFQKQQQEDIAVSPQYLARAAASKVVEQQASPKISNFPFWFSQNQKTNSILRKGFEIENSLAVMSPLNGHNKGPYKRSFWFQHLWYLMLKMPFCGKYWFAQIFFSFKNSVQISIMESFQNF